MRTRPRPTGTARSDTPAAARRRVAAVLVGLALPWAVPLSARAANPTATPTKSSSASSRVLLSTTKAPELVEGAERTMLSQSAQLQTL